MRVKIEHKEVEKGMFKKRTYHRVYVTVAFSEEELAIIDNSNLKDLIIIERKLPPNLKPSDDPEDDRRHCALSLRQLLGNGPSGYLCATPLDAKHYETELTEALHQLKAVIEENAGVEEKSKTFEI